MKKTVVAINILVLLLLVAPATVRAECVNNVDTVSGRTCVVVTPNTGITYVPCGPGTFSDSSGRCWFPSSNSTNGNLSYTPLEPLPGGPKTIDQNTSLASILNSWYKILISVGGMFAVLMIVIGGVEYMVSSVPGVKKKGRERALAAVFGLVLLVASYLILSTINPQLLIFNFSPPVSNFKGGPVQQTNNNLNNNNNNSTQACGPYQSCSSGYHCGMTTGWFGNTVTTCLQN